MDEQLRSTGIEPAGLVPWGTHMCLFYRTPGELIDALAAYFKAGLQNNECCVWITSDPLVQAEARLALERLFPEQEQCELRRYRRLGQIEIYDYKEWYVRSMAASPVAASRVAASPMPATTTPIVALPDTPLPSSNQGSVFSEGSVFSPERVLHSWVEKEQQARRLGFDGLRVSGDTSWLGVLFQDEKPIIWNHEIWSTLARYENRVGQLMQNGSGPLDPHLHMLALCTYDLEQCSPAEIIEATTNHELTLIRADENCREADQCLETQNPAPGSNAARPAPAWRAIYSASFDRVEEALEASQKSYQALVESSANHVFMLSPQGVYLTSNDRVRQFGFGDAEQLAGKKLEEVYPPELAESYRQQMERVLETGLTVEFEHPMSQPDGEHTHLDTLYPIYRYGLVWAVGGACHDITQRKRFELARKEREDRLHNLFESAPEAIFIKDRSLRYTLANPLMAKMLDLPVEQIVGKGTADLFGPEAAVHLEQVDRRVLAGEIVEEIDTHTVRGEQRRFHVIKAPLRDDAGQITGLAGLLRDDTAHLPARDTEMLDCEKQTLQESERRYRLLFDNMQDGFAWCRMLYEQDQPVDFIYLEVNQAFERLTGLKEVNGKRVSQLIPGLRQTNPELFEVYSRVAQTGLPVRFESYVAPLDTWFSVSVYSTQKEHFTAVFDNISERKRNEALLRASLNEKEILLKEVHHRVKNNLAVISALLDMQAQLSPDRSVQAAFTDSQQRILAISGIHEQLYHSNDLGRIDMTGYLEKMVHDLVSVYARRQVALRLEIEQVSLPVDQAIPCGLIINELVTNALKYAFVGQNAEPAPAGDASNPAYNTVDLRLDPAYNTVRQAEDNPAYNNPVPEITVTLKPASSGQSTQRTYILKISDNGAGLPGDIDPKQPQQLGLKLVARLAGQLDGVLEVENAGSKSPGSAFTITFPEAA